MDHRPEKLSEINIQAEASAVRDAEDLFRLYREEWVIVHTVTGTYNADSGIWSTLQKARDHAKEHYRGRVEPMHIRIDASIDDADNPVQVWVHVLLFKPNLKGEFKHARLAANFAAQQDWEDWEIVSRNSRRDHELRNYGVKRAG